MDISPFETDDNARAVMRPLVRQSLNLNEEEIVLLFSGKLSHRKGPDLILHAIKQLPSAVREKVSVIFLGSGQMRSELERLAQEPPRVNVFFQVFKIKLN